MLETEAGRLTKEYAGAHLPYMHHGCTVRLVVLDDPVCALRPALSSACNPASRGKPKFTLWTQLDRVYVQSGAKGTVDRNVDDHSLTSGDNG